MGRAVFDDVLHHQEVVGESLALDDPEFVLDPFGGSGTTLIACERTGRQARLIELDPKYCDVIVQRFEKFTGKKAERISSQKEKAA